MKIEVRPLRDTDIEELSRIEAASFSMPWSAEDFRGLLLRDYCLYVVAETDGHIAGCAGLTDSFHEGNIDNVVTAPEYRNLGVGSKMLEELLRLGAERGIIVYTAKNNATIFPKSQMQDKTTDVIEMISTHMPPAKVKIRS
jgi:[ribosomal protein S18]-alanine N-acetyltransferase